MITGVLTQKEQLTFLGGLFFFAWSIDLCGFLSKMDIEMCCFPVTDSIEKCENALSAFVKNEDYHVKKAYVLSNTREITTSGKITYIPIYDVMFLGE